MTTGRLGERLCFIIFCIGKELYTLPETNIFAPENGWLEDDPFLLVWPMFRGELLVSGRVSIQNQLKSVNHNPNNHFETAEFLNGQKILFEAIVLMFDWGGLLLLTW